MALDTSLDDMDMLAKLSITQKGISGTRVAIVDAAGWVPTAISLMGTTITVGDKQIKLTAHSWPGIPSLKVDTIDLEMYGKSIVSDWNTGPASEKVKLTIGYVTDETGEEGEDDQENNNSDKPEKDIDEDTVLIQSVDFGVDVVCVPCKGTATGALSDANGQPVTQKTREVKKYIRIPSITYTATLPYVINPDWAKLRDNVGKVNTDKIFGGAPGTVLFDGPKADRELKALMKKKGWKITLKMIYQRHGWNKILHPDTLEWVDATTVNGSTKPYEEAALKPLLTNLSKTLVQNT